jgi:vacuolar-type H+-ATPase subunit H
MSTEAAPAPGPGDSLEPIKRVTSIEAEVDRKVAELRTSLKAQLEAIQRESEAALLQARTDAERAREALLAAARAEGDAEAAKIVAEGTAEAVTIRPLDAAELARRRDAILSAVLGEFRPAGKRSPA